jgi:PAS domain S-box-containing protein
MVEARLASVLDTEPDAIVAIDEEARILICNKGCEQLFGFPAAELLSRSRSV